MNPHPTPLSRRGLLTALTALPVAAGSAVVLADPASATAPGSANSTAPSSTAARDGHLRIRGADLSFTLSSRRQGSATATAVAPARRAHPRPNGANWARLRVWVDPPAG